MRIAEWHIYQRDLPVKDGPYTFAGQEVWTLDTTLVRLVSDTGIEGWGEVCPLGARYAPVSAGIVRAALTEIGESLIGVTADFNSVMCAVDTRILGQNYARSALDIAVHDLMGKALRVPVATLLGGAMTDRLPSYFATGIGDPDEIARLAADKVAWGYPRIQVKIGGRDVAEDIATLRKVHEAVGGHALLAADANRGLSQRDALRLSRECAAIPFALEQPCSSIEEVAAIRAQISHPIYLDESMTDLNTVLRVVGEGLADGFGMKLSRLGGLRPFSAFRDICATRGLFHTCDDSWGGDIVAAACAHMGAACDSKRLEAVWLATPYVEGSYVPDCPVSVEAGHVLLPKGPGLGLAIDAAQFDTPLASFGG